MKTSAELAVEATGLVKLFGRAPAVDGVDLAVPAASVYGLLGPNGAGKTTTIRILATLLRPDAGSARVLGHDTVREADAVRRGISLTGQFSSVDQDLTGHENLVLLGRLLGLPRRPAKARASELLDAFGLSAASGRRVATYSGGMQRRLDLAASIVVIPDLLFLDEPTTGLDPHSRNQVWEIIRSLAGRGTTVLLTTQYLEEADRLADRIAVVDQGRMIAEGTGAELRSSVGAATLHVRLQNPQHRPRAERVLRRAIGGSAQLVSNTATLSALVPDPETAARAVSQLSERSVAVAEFALTRPSLDEVFLALTGRQARHDPEPPDSASEQENAA